MQLLDAPGHLVVEIVGAALFLVVTASHLRDARRVERANGGFRLVA